MLDVIGGDNTVFGRWMSQTGWAGPLMVLPFACSWIPPLLTCLVAGDVFAWASALAPTLAFAAVGLLG